MYENFGFAVFKFKKSVTDLATVHPIAFEFPRRDPESLFIPTVHVHDGVVHEYAHFDHTIFFQSDVDQSFARQSSTRASDFLNFWKAEGIVDPGEYCWMMSLKGDLENIDTIVGNNARLPRYQKYI